ncbi:hypothetical protein [Moraxella sp. ZY210820]|uniref:hypothetical protein n=1 Tax=unclassified Moraxella TaxID=2685852 RepID=UPI002730999E|nr:hypothetical protein [Moraxella sp. ZY210820]WLF83873.1 hypothetical protein LU301_11635 [Moraxella sp. ZY210820]
MNKIFALVLVLVSGLCLTACDKAPDNTSSQVGQTTSAIINDGWVELGTKTGGIAVDYYQPASQRQMDDYQVITFKTILIQDDSKRKLKTGDYLIGELVLDCKNKQGGLLKSKLYGANQTLKHEFDMTNNLQMKSIVQGEPTGRLWKQVCT